MAMSSEQIRLLDASWRAANYLTVGQIYLRDNPLLPEPLTPAHVKPRLLGHWGTSPGERDEGGALAVAMFVYQARKQAGALAAALGGLDTLVFTGGIGARAAPVRAEICDGLGHLGVHLDPARNAAHGNPTGKPGSACQVRIVATREDLMIARHTRGVLFPDGERRHRGQ